MEEEKIRVRDYIRVIIAILLLILCIITSFRTGQKYYELRNSRFDDSESYVESDVAEFRFRVLVRY